MSTFTRNIKYSNVTISDLEGKVLKSYKTNKNVTKKSVMKSYLKSVNDDFKPVKIEISSNEEKREMPFDLFMTHSTVVKEEQN